MACRWKEGGGCMLGSTLPPPLHPHHNPFQYPVPQYPAGVTEVEKKVIIFTILSIVYFFVCMYVCFCVSYKYINYIYKISLCNLPYITITFIYRKKSRYQMREAIAYNYFYRRKQKQERK